MKFPYTPKWLSTSNASRLNKKHIYCICALIIVMNSLSVRLSKQ